MSVAYAPVVAERPGEARVLMPRAVVRIIPDTTRELRRPVSVTPTLAEVEG